LNDPVPIETLLRSDSFSTNIHSYQRERMLLAAEKIDRLQAIEERIKTAAAKARNDEAVYRDAYVNSKADDMLDLSYDFAWRAEGFEELLNG
jgi:hypothetical protein